MYQHKQFQTVNSLFPLVKHQHTKLLLSLFHTQISEFQTRLSEEIFTPTQIFICLRVKTQKQTTSEAAKLRLFLCEAAF